MPVPKTRVAAVAAEIMSFLNIVSSFQSIVSWIAEPNGYPMVMVPSVFNHTICAGKPEVAVVAMAHGPMSVVLSMAVAVSVAMSMGLGCANGENHRRCGNCQGG